MDTPRITSPPSIRVDYFNPNFDRRRPTSRSSSNTSIQSFSSRGPMSIPNAREEIVPPPLPPPRYIEDLANGHDPGWKWGNTFNGGGFGKSTLAPINPASSLYGGHRRPDLEDRDESMDLEHIDRRGSTVSTIQSPSDPEIKMEPLQPVDEGFQSPVLSGMANYKLQGERPLEKKSLDQASNAYDKHLLSKIGKPNSPPRHMSLGSAGENASPTAKLAFHPKSGNKLKSLSVSDGSLDPVSRWVQSPPSAGASPGARPSWSKDFMDYRSPSVDSSAPSSAVDSEHYAHLRDGSRRSGSGSMPINFDDIVSLPSRSNRGSYDQGSFAETDMDFPMEQETGALRQLIIGVRTPPHSEGHSPNTNQSLKRRASSPPREASRDDKQPLHSVSSSGDLYQRRSSGHPSYNRTSPNSRSHPNHGSVSSTSSMRNGSLASSASLSAGGSSMTSISSFDRHSPGGISPSSDNLEAIQDSPYVTSVSLNPSPRGSLSTSRNPHNRTTSESKSAQAARKMSVQSAVNTTKSNSAPKIGGLYICECCPKKPKKFDSQDELRIHEMEKQYTCQYCHNRFKNKNEAERHQNSLHLRRHSWSCAALAGYEAAFHSSTSPNAQTPNGPSSDGCGYCGEEFPNFPQQDWEHRVEHLTNIHKFGECNQAKKFYRADHFRQHLKHSHAGTSGKWTNMLENACMKDEPPVEARMGTASDPGGRSASSAGGGTPGSGGGVMGKTIDEERDES